MEELNKEAFNEEEVRNMRDAYDRLTTFICESQHIRPASLMGILIAMASNVAITCSPSPEEGYDVYTQACSQFGKKIILNKRDEE